MNNGREFDKILKFPGDYATSRKVADSIPDEVIGFLI
jgi:hypothetical protein